MSEKSELEIAVEALKEVRDLWKHSGDCDASFQSHLNDEWWWCDCYRWAARSALEKIGHDDGIGALARRMVPQPERIWKIDLEIKKEDNDP